jgi:hypothetical protein
MPGSTPIYLFPYPVGADPADGPAGFQNLANRVETVIHDTVIPPLTTRLGTLETTLTGVSNDGTGKLTVKGLNVTPGDLTVAGKLTVSGVGSMIQALSIGTSGASGSNGVLTVYNDFTVYGGGASPILRAFSSSFGVFGKTNSQKSGSSLSNAVNNLPAGDTKNGLSECLACFRAFGFMS